MSAKLRALADVNEIITRAESMRHFIETSETSERNQRLDEIQIEYDAKLTEKIKSLEALLESHQTSKHVLTQLQDEYDTSQRKIQSLQKTCRELDESNRELERQVRQEKIDATRLEVKIENLEAKESHYQDTVSSYKKHVEHLNLIVSQSEDKKSSREMDIRMEERTMSRQGSIELLNEIANEQCKNKTLQEQLLKVTKENEDLVISCHSSYHSGKMYQVDILGILREMFGEWCELIATWTAGKVSDIHIVTRDDNIFLLLELKHRGETWINRNVTKHEIARFHADTRTTNADRGILFTNASVGAFPSELKRYGIFTEIGNDNFQCLFSVITSEIANVRYEKFQRDHPAAPIVVGLNEISDFVTLLGNGYGQTRDCIHRIRDLINKFWTESQEQTRGIRSSLTLVSCAAPVFQLEKHRNVITKHCNESTTSASTTTITSKTSSPACETATSRICEPAKPQAKPVVSLVGLDVKEEEEEVKEPRTKQQRRN